MTTETICFRVDAAERAEIAVHAARDKVSLSDYIRVRLGLRGEGPQPGNGADDQDLHARLADHEARLRLLEGDRAAIAVR